MITYRNRFLSVYMPILVCTFKNAFPHIYIRALTVHLSVSVTAPWWLLFAPSRGGEDEVMLGGEGSLAGKCVLVRCLITQRCFSSRGSEVGKVRVPGSQGWSGDTAVSQMSGSGSTRDHKGPNISHQSDEPITWKENEKRRELNTHVWYIQT